MCPESTRRTQFSWLSFHEAFHAAPAGRPEAVTKSDDSAACLALVAGLTQACPEDLKKLQLARRRRVNGSAAAAR